MRYGVWLPFFGLLQGQAASAAQATAPHWKAVWTLERRAHQGAAQNIKSYLTVAAGSALVSAACWLSGLHSRAHLAVIELLALCLMLRLVSRHASDQDLISMNPSLVRVERRRAGRVRRVDFNPRWVRVEPELHDGSLVRMAGQGRSVLVGGFLPRAARPQLAEELRWALRHLND